MKRQSTFRNSISSSGPLPPTQLLLRNANRLIGDNIVFLGVPRDQTLAGSFGNRSGALVSFDYGGFLIHSALLRASGSHLTPHFTAHYESPKTAPHDLAIVYLQKGNEFNDLILAVAARAVRMGGVVVLVGENKAGIRSNVARLEGRVGRIRFSDAARHCALYEAIVSGEELPRLDLADWRHEFDVTVDGRVLSIVSLPGVFSHGRLDEGTSFLLSNLPEDIQGDVLDFGCGTGVIGAAIKTLHPSAVVTLVDTSAFAIEASKRTFARNSISAKSIHPVDVFKGIEDSFDFIVSNPPFHQGVETNYEIVTSFFDSCDRHLKPGGRLLIVANRFLPYEGQMATALMAPSVIAENTKYKVLCSRKRS